MPDDQTNPGSQGTSAALTIPDDVAQKFGPIIELIKGSESMNNEERQYWVNILPIMTAEQLKNLEEILVNEKKQLAAIDEKYSKQIAAVGEENIIAQMEEERKKKRQQRSKTEQTETQEREKNEEDILNKIQSL